MKNIMCDIETLGLRPGSAIISIGAVAWEGDQITSEFYTVIDLDSCRMNGLREDPATRAWWDAQSGEARKALVQADTGQGRMLDVALNEFAAWLVGADDEEFLIWGNGAAFDVPILEAAYVRVAQSIPWDYRNVRCFRTLRGLDMLPRTEWPADEAVAHHALDDARWQAKFAMAALRNIADYETFYAHTGAGNGD
jgi:DNA polymerase III epsilon subunit-like protein